MGNKFYRNLLILSALLFTGSVQAYLWRGSLPKEEPEVENQKSEEIK